MINLLPTDQRQMTVYARRNRTMLHWCVAALIAIAGIVLIMVFGKVYIARAEQNLRSANTVAQARISSEKLEQSQKDFEELSNGVKTVVQILSKQVLFSELVPRIGAALPDGAVLTNLTLTPGDVALDLQIETKTAEIASQTQVNFADPKNELFDKADIISINCTPSTNDNYPCDLSIRVLYKKDASFLFLNTLKKQGNN